MLYVFMTTTALKRYKHEHIITFKASLRTIKEVQNMYAIIETGGKQLKVEVGQTVFVEKLEVAEGEEVIFDKVLVYSNRTTRVGSPYVDGVSVKAKVEKQGKAKKIIVFKYKPKKGSTRRKQGHRQPYTRLVIEEINA